MFEKFVQLEAANFKQRYQGTYGFFRKGDNKVLVRLESIRTGDVRAQVDFVDKDDNAYHLYSDSEDSSIGFEFLPPKSSYHNTTTGTFLVKRVPAKQYQRGICERNTSIRTVNNRGVTVGFESLLALYNDKVDHLQRYEQVVSPEYKGEEKTFAISNQFAISLEEETIYCLGTSIGEARLRYNKLVIRLNDSSLWRTEIHDCLTRTGIKGIIQ